MKTNNYIPQVIQSSSSDVHTRLLSDLLTLFSFTEELVLNIGYIQKSDYPEKIKNEKYKKAFSDFYNRLPILDIMTADTDSPLVEELLKMMNTHVFNQPLKLQNHGN